MISFKLVPIYFRQIGDAGVTCLCPKGFKGRKCQTAEEEDVSGKCISMFDVSSDIILITNFSFSVDFCV